MANTEKESPRIVEERPPRIPKRLPPPVVMIMVDHGKIVCNPWKLVVQRGTPVRFDCARPFAVHFGGETPFPQLTLSGSGSVMTGPIPRDMPYGAYGYFVAVYDGAHVIAEDPDIIIVP